MMWRSRSGGDERFHQVGRVLITHWGLSGPATLRLTAFAARALQASRYRATLSVSWCVGWSQADLLAALRNQRNQAARRTLVASRPLAAHLPRRLWVSMLEEVGVAADQRWADCPAKVQKGLFDQLQQCRYPVKGRGPFGEEFVTAGGVDLGEINLATMESRCCPGCMAGELMDVDEVTGGFNFRTVDQWLARWPVRCRAAHWI